MPVNINKTVHNIKALDKLKFAHSRPCFGLETFLIKFQSGGARVDKLLVFGAGRFSAFMDLIS